MLEFNSYLTSRLQHLKLQSPSVQSHLTGSFPPGWEVLQNSLFLSLQCSWFWRCKWHCRSLPFQGTAKTSLAHLPAQFWLVCHTSVCSHHTVGPLLSLWEYLWPLLIEMKAMTPAANSRQISSVWKIYALSFIKVHYCFWHFLDVWAQVLENVRVGHCDSAVCCIAFINMLYIFLVRAVINSFEVIRWETVSIILTQHHWGISFPPLSFSDTLVVSQLLFLPGRCLLPSAGSAGTLRLMGWTGRQRTRRNAGSLTLPCIHMPARSNGYRSDSGSSEVQANICIDFSGSGSALVYTNESKLFFPKGDKVIFSFHREKGSADAIFPALPLGQSI